MTVTMDKAGRIVIPVKMRERLHLRPGVEFDIEATDSRIELEPRREKGRIEYRHGIPVLVFDTPMRQVDFDVRAELRKDYDRRAEFHAGLRSSPVDDGQ